MLKIYNSLSKRKEEFKPIELGKVSMYVCGMTVYDYCHIGHARMLVVFDMIYRHLRYKGFDVTYVRNITDIDDKIINRANENNEAFTELTERFIQEMYADIDDLGILRPDFEPRATENIDAIIKMISTLIDKKHAYHADNGDVYYSVSSFVGYGKLSGKKTEDLRSGARIDIDEAKNDPLDFVLWKSVKPDEPSWDSPWGKGRPGWHIECSAMSTQQLGESFDIHGGGHDLQFPHHENEIAQSEACYGKQYVNYWIHNGFVRVNDEKMSKSLSNFFTIREVLKWYKAEELRFFLLSNHYRSPLNYSKSQLDEARTSLDRLYMTLRDAPPPNLIEGIDVSYQQRFEEAMDDDFNTREALSILFELANNINKYKDKEPGKAAGMAVMMKELVYPLGLLQADPDQYLKERVSPEGIEDDDIQELIEQREIARDERNWGESDRIRDLLEAQGVTLEDGAEGTTWRRTS